MDKRGKAYIGTSGWNYKHWKQGFYHGAPQSRWLSYCSSRFTGIEINATFYRSQQPSTFQKWRDQTPPSFKFAMKGNRYLTHNRKLKDPVEPLQREKERATAMGDKLAVVVWQLPRMFGKNLERLETFAAALGDWPQVRHTIEFRHQSWFDDDVASCLERNRIAVCMSDAPDWPLWDRVTTDLVYIRLHGHTVLYLSAYNVTELRDWADRARGWLDEGRNVHIYFDNDGQGHAPVNAMQLLEILETR